MTPRIAATDVRDATANGQQVTEGQQGWRADGRSAMRSGERRGGGATTRAREPCAGKPLLLHRAPAMRRAKRRHGSGERRRRNGVAA